MNGSNAQPFRSTPLRWTAQSPTNPARLSTLPQSRTNPRTITEDSFGRRPECARIDEEGGASRLSVRPLSRETGLSRRYLRTILDGVAVPHPMRWPALADAVVR